MSTALPARRRASLVAVAAATLALLVSITPATAQEEPTITVDTTSDLVDFGGAQTVADLPGPDGQTSLREAAIASTNTAGPETIAFDIPTSDPGFTGDGFVIRIDPASPAEELTIGDDATTIDATTQPGGFSITVEGGPQSNARLGGRPPNHLVREHGRRAGRPALPEWDPRRRRLRQPDHRGR